MWFYCWKQFSSSIKFLTNKSKKKTPLEKKTKFYAKKNLSVVGNRKDKNFNQKEIDNIKDQPRKNHLTEEMSFQ